MSPTGFKPIVARHAALALALALVAFWRLEQIRPLALPAWVDSVHHTLAVRMLLEQRGLPETWAPYLPGVPFYYHFGFHVSAAAFAWLTGLTGLQLGRAVLLVGQLWQVGLAWGIYLLARSLRASRAQALSALILVAFVSQMPAFYVSWGRYSLLAGLTLLVFGMAAALEGRGVATAALVAAASLTHYYAFLLLLLFIALHLAASRDRRRRLVVGAAAAAGALATTPWLIRVWLWSRAYARAPRGGGPGAAGGAAAAPAWQMLGPLRNQVLLVLAAAGAVVLARQALRAEPEQRARLAALLGFGLALVALMGPWQIGPFRPDHAAIVLFLPAVLLAAAALAALPRPAAWAATLALALWGAQETRRIVHPDTVLAEASDLAALAWVESHTPPQACFLVDVQPWMGLWRGADGGWWIMPLTGRRTVLPPAAHGWGQPELSALVRAHAARMDAVSRAAFPEHCIGLERLMEETGADYYYTHSPRPLQCPQLTAVYAGAGELRIFALAHRPADEAAPPRGRS